MINEATSDVWYKNAVIYCLDVETFVDSASDGIGDFRGLTRRVDYLAGLGVTCIWLMPFYPTANLDDGYDVTDYYGVDPRLGTLGDFVDFMRAANERGIRVIVDLVVNHTSWHHPWFQSARSDPGSAYRDWYVWAKHPPDAPTNLVFPDAEESNWEYDEAAGEFYLHRFYTAQPDLNVQNPAVRDEIHRIMGFWLQLGVAGFRVDAVPYLIERIGESGIHREGGHDYLRHMREFLQRRRGDAVLLGEVNLPPEKTYRYFGEGTELQLILNFYGNGKLYLAMARGERGPVVRLLDDLALPPRTCQWANFVRNHDEATFSMLPDDEQDEVLDAFAPREEARIFGRGIRRRLPPMVDGDQRRIRLAYSLMLTLPGTPTLYYGEEIGMGDDLSLDGRMSVRVPMQWNGGTSAGFSRAAPSDLIRPVVDDGPFRYTEVNVADQRQDPDSLLNWFERAIRSRKECPAFGWGEPRILDVGDDAVFAIRSDWMDQTLVALHNFSDAEATVRLPAQECAGVTTIADVFGNARYDRVDPQRPQAQLEAFGYRWLRMEHRQDVASSV